LFKKVVLVVLFLIALGSFATGGASAEDLSRQLADAEERVTTSEEAVSNETQEVETAEQHYRKAAERAAPFAKDAERAEEELVRLQDQLNAREQHAGARLSRLQERHQEEEEDQAQEVRDGVGFGLAALVAGLIAIAWGWFRATAAVAALTEIELGQAIGVCVGGGLLLLVVGVVIGGSTGAIGAVGSFIFWLGLILPMAFLLARHSAQVQRGRSRAVLRRERLPNWTSAAIASLMFLAFLAGTGSAIFADGASSQPVSAELRQEAEAASTGQGAEELKAAEEEVAEAKRQAAGPVASRSAAQRKLADARSALHSAQQSLVAARSDVRTIGRRLVALEAREQREAEREEARLAREEEERDEEEAEELASQCNPNYSGCLDPYSPDYDCEGGSGDGPDYTGTVEVIGYDEYELDANNNGIGCE